MKIPLRILVIKFTFSNSQFFWGGGGGGWHQIIKIEENFISKGGCEKFFRFYRPNFIKIGTLLQELQHFFWKITTFLQIFSKSEFFGFYGDMSRILYTLKDQNHKDLSGAHFGFKFGSSRTQCLTIKYFIENRFRFFDKNLFHKNR